MRPSFLIHDEHIPLKPAFPTIDGHNHLWSNWESVDQVVEVLDDVGIAAYCDLTANIQIAWGNGGYILNAGRFDSFLENCAARHPGRFYAFTTAAFARDPALPLFTDARAFVEEAIELLRLHVAAGARGLKILKELGMRYRDGDGQLIRVDDPRLAPIWDEAARLAVPVLMHQSDPYGFFEPVTPENEHFESLKKYPSWSFVDRERFPDKLTLLQCRDRLIKRHPKTTFLLPHVANFAENLGGVGRLLDENPNVYIDFSARLDELGRQPYSARDFLIQYQDRIFFGTDMPASREMYRCYFRFLETRDEWFPSPDYDGTFERVRWGIHGVNLPGSVLEKIYCRNLLRLIPGLVSLD